MNSDLKEAQEILRGILGPKLNEMIDILNDGENEDGKYVIFIPDIDKVDATKRELASLVARSSNAYQRIARFAGMARAEYKLAKGNFDYKFKKTQGEGKNEAERKANAMEACEEEHHALTIAEAIAEFADSAEFAARIASESTRKIYDKISSMEVADKRQSHGTLTEDDFSGHI